MRTSGTLTALMIGALLSAASAATQDPVDIFFRVTSVGDDGSVSIYVQTPVDITNFKFDLVGGIDELPVHISSIKSTPAGFSSSYYENNVVGLSFNGAVISGSGEFVELISVFVNVPDDLSNSICIDHLTVTMPKKIEAEYEVVCSETGAEIADEEAADVNIMLDSVDDHGEFHVSMTSSSPVGAFKFKVTGPNGQAFTQMTVDTIPIKDQFGFDVIVYEDGTVSGEPVLGSLYEKQIPKQPEPLQLVTLRVFLPSGQVPCIKEAIFLSVDVDSKAEKSLSVEEPPCDFAPEPPISAWNELAPEPPIAAWNELAPPPFEGQFDIPPSLLTPLIESYIYVSPIDATDNSFTITSDSTVKIAGFQCDVMSAGSENIVVDSVSGLPTGFIGSFNDRRIIIFSLQGASIELGQHQLAKVKISTEGDVNDLNLCLDHVVLGDPSALPIVYEVECQAPEDPVDSLAQASMRVSEVTENGQVVVMMASTAAITDFRFDVVTAEGAPVHIAAIEDTGLSFQFQKDISFAVGDGGIHSLPLSGQDIPPQDDYTILLVLKVEEAPGTSVCINGALFFYQSTMISVSETPCKSFGLPYEPPSPPSEIPSPATVLPQSPPSEIPSPETISPQPSPSQSPSPGTLSPPPVGTTGTPPEDLSRTSPPPTSKIPASPAEPRYSPPRSPSGPSSPSSPAQDRDDANAGPKVHSPGSATSSHNTITTVDDGKDKDDKSSGHSEVAIALTVVAVVLFVCAMLVATVFLRRRQTQRYRCLIPLKDPYDDEYIELSSSFDKKNDAVLRGFAQV